MFENEIMAFFSNPFATYSFAFLAVCIGFRLLLTGIAKVIQAVHGKAIEIYTNDNAPTPTKKRNGKGNQRETDKPST